MKLNLLDHFYEYLEEDDWLDGVDLYQAGRVESIERYESLLMAKVSDGPRPNEVRLKLHPAGRCIQWIECTCHKNRAKGQYCEHIAALMIHVDREEPKVFGNLDTTMPLKPPTMPRKSKAPKAVKAREKAGTSTENAAAAHKILDHLKGNIHGVSLLTHGPKLRVRVEIKEGSITHYDLDLDASAKFLEDQPNLKTVSPEVKALKVYDVDVLLGTKLFQPDPEKIVAERCVAIKLHRKLSPKQEAAIRIEFETGIFTKSVSGEENEKPQLYMFIPLKTANKYIGNKYFFLPGRGYFPLDKSPTHSSWSDLPLSRVFKDDQAAMFAQSKFSEYLNSGPLFLDENLKDPVVLEAPDLTEVKVLSSGHGWFKLDPTYGEGKSAVSMVDLMKQHRKEQRKFIRSGDKWVMIPEFVTEHNWQLDESGESVQVDALGLMRIKAAVGDFDQFVGSKRALSVVRDNMEFKPETAAPKISHSKLDLRHYQDLGLRWLWWLYQNGMHGLLADEMGLGKTHQAMAVMSAIQTKNPNGIFLVVCPTTVLDHWVDKINDFAPNLKCLKYHGTKRAHLLADFDRGYHCLVTSYGVLLRDIKKLSEYHFESLILDEAHFVKNNTTATYKAACKINSNLRVALTGTPLENHLGELKSLFDFLVPGYLGSDKYFKKNFINPIQKNDEPDTELALQKLIHPFKMRRTKSLVLPDLPEKVEDLRHCGLSGEQVKLYRDIINMKAAPILKQLKEDGSPVPFLHVFATLTMLKQLCNHPALLNKDEDFEKYSSGKFELLKELLDEAIGSGHKVVIYSQYVGMVKIISNYLKKIQVGHETLTGQTRNRGEKIKNFQENPEIKVFVASLMAGGVGIDLTSASVVIHYDRWWNASKENQATDRVHRIGQNRNVQVMKLVTRGTLEEKIDRMITRKAALFEKFMDKDEEVFKKLSRQDIIELLE